MEMEQTLTPSPAVELPSAERYEALDGAETVERLLKEAERLRDLHVVNVLVAGKQPEPQYLDLDTAVGIGIWEWASNDRGAEPNVVMACVDVPTLETLAAVYLLRQHLPELRVRVVNDVDLWAWPHEPVSTMGVQEA